MDPRSIVSDVGAGDGLLIQCLKEYMLKNNFHFLYYK